MGSEYRKLLPVNDAFAQFLRSEHGVDVPVGCWLDVHHSWDPAALAKRFDVYRVEWSISTTTNSINLWGFAFDECVRVIRFDTPDDENGELPSRWMADGDPLPFEDTRAVRRLMKRKSAEADVDGSDLLEAVLGQSPHPRTLLAEPRPLPRKAGTSKKKAKRIIRRSSS